MAAPDDPPPVRAFGEWDAPMTDGAEWIDVPTGLACMFCRRHFEAGDNGAIMPDRLQPAPRVQSCEPCWAASGITSTTRATATAS
jgi:hypothetical protein